MSRTTHATISLLGMLAAASCRDATAEKVEKTQKTQKAVMLGRALFFDPALSAGGNQACSACHLADVGWTGPNEWTNKHSSVYVGSIRERMGTRKPTTAAYATFAPLLALDDKGHPVGGNFWDGRATGWKLGNPAADQAQGPFLNPVEQALPDPAAVVARVCKSRNGELFREVWGRTACTNIDEGFADIAMSIQAFEGSRAVSAFDSKYDKFIAGSATLSRTEQRGLALFEGKAKCATCHSTRGDARARKALFTDFTFDNVGIPRNPDITNLAEPDPGLGGFLGELAADDKWRSQRYVTTSFADLQAGELRELARANRGKQRVPTLRNVDRRPQRRFVKAYTHNGYFKSLESLVHFYNTRDVLPRCEGLLAEYEALAKGCWPAPEVAENLNTEVGNLGLTGEEEAAVVAFLRTLTDGAP